MIYLGAECEGKRSASLCLSEVFVVLTVLKVVFFNCSLLKLHCHFVVSHIPLFLCSSLVCLSGPSDIC